ncbi:WD domain-containing protein [Cladophialophora immunda]|nr:WD domain-containing protein [Cladophialophora immunda]
MAENMPTPASPGTGRYPGPGLLSSGTSDTADDSGPDLSDSPPEIRMLRCIERHDKDFREKLDVLTRLTKMVARDHAKSIRHLKKACMGYAPGNRSNHQTRPAPTAPEPTVDESIWAAPRQAEEATEEHFVENSTSKQLTSTLIPQDVANAAIGSPPQTVLPPAAGDPLPNGDNHELYQPSRLEEPSGEEHENSSLDDTDDDRGSSYSTDDDDHDKDIIHEESPTADETTRIAPAETQPTTTTTPPRRVAAQIRQAPASQPSKSSQATRDGSRRWTDAEENFMIDTIHDLMQEQDLGPTKTYMWQRASAILSTRGYDRTFQQMMAKWSCDTRHKCEARGLAWAATVMAKLPHMVRKRKSSLGDAEGKRASARDGQPKVKRVKIKSQKVLDTQTQAPDQLSSSAPSHVQDPRSSLNGQVRPMKPKRRSRKNIDVHPALSPRQGFTTKFDSLPTTSGNHMRLRFIWSHASSDIVQVDWSPDGKYFAAASNSIFDPSTNFRDNRPVNLIHGSLSSKTLRELPEHRVAGNVDAGQPKHVYQTVSAVRFAPTGHRIYSAGFDNKVRVWDVEDEAFIHCKAEIQYAQRLEVMDVAGEQSPLFATGTAGGLRPIRVFFADSDVDLPPQEIHSLRETVRRAFPYSPTCLKFGHARSRDWLLAGFGSDTEGGFGEGLTAMWKFREASCEQLHFPRGETFVFDCAWSPSGELFAIGSASDAMSRADTAENSVVKLYSPNQPDSIARYSCRAKDINDVTIDFGLVTASCTDGSTYVWDQRQPQKPLHTLAHGQPVMQLLPGADRELEDVGVRYIEWSHNTGQLYTGSSDGFLKYWDTRRSPADVLLEDLVDTGREILCGRLSPDHSSLLLGDEEGRLHLLSTSNGPSPEEQFQFRVAEGWNNDN